ADKSIDLSLHLEPDLPELVLGDPQRLRQIVLNLVGNAVKFTDGGRVLVSAGVRPADDGRTLSVAVFDTGGGIPADMVDVIFDSFVQAHDDESAVATGTGLGLSIAKKLVERMGGTIGVRSSVGVGSCFWFVLPFAEVTNQPAPALPAGSDPAFEVSDTPLRLLVADDNEINRRVARGLLGALGHEVLLVGDGREAVEMVRSVPVDAVFMDAQMPIMDGLEATAAIRALPGPESATPIIAMTASALDADRDRFLAGGMDDCAFKPLVWDDLRAVLERAVISRPDATTAEDDHHEPGQDPLDQRILHGLVLLHRSGQRLDELLDGFELRAEGTPAGDHRSSRPRGRPHRRVGRAQPARQQRQPGRRSAGIHGRTAGAERRGRRPRCRRGAGQVHAGGAGAGHAPAAGNVRGTDRGWVIHRTGAGRDGRPGAAYGWRP
ncbi:MAG: ATP-binding protein, partial [Actinomycetota bacterium]